MAGTKTYMEAVGSFFGDMCREAGRACGAAAALLLSGQLPLRPRNNGEGQGTSVMPGPGHASMHVDRAAVHIVRYGRIPDCG